MADKNNKKETTPPPLLFMGASDGLTLNPPTGSNMLMPVPQVDPNLFQPEEGEADSFLGQTPPQQQPMSFFQPPPSSSPDPFSQIRQPDPSAAPTPPTAPNIPNVSRPENTPTPPMGLISGAAVPPATSLPQSMAPAPQVSQGSQFRMAQGGLKRPQYAKPPTGTYAQDGGFPQASPPMMPPGMPPTSMPPLHSTPYGDPRPGQFGPPPPQDTFGGPNQSAPVPNIASPSHRPGLTTPYIPVHHHWFFCKNIELRQIWQPFSIVDSVRLEEAFRAGVHDNLIISSDGGRYDVDISERTRTPVYWDEIPNKVRRCSWFYRPEGDNRCIPYEEEFSARLEEEYKNALINDVWHKRLEFPGGETIVMHNPSVIVHFRPSAQPDEWGTTQVRTEKGDQVRPRVVKRGVDEFDEIADGEPTQVDHVVFVVHGIGPTCDLRFRNIIECVDDFRALALQIVDSHFRQYSDEGRIGRVEFLPVRWHSALHNDATGVDRKLKSITLNSIGKLRHFTNDTLVDILFYTSPQYAQTITDTVSGEVNRLYQMFLARNPDFHGAVSVAGHSLGSLILFDLLRNQRDPNAPPEPEPANAAPAPEVAAPPSREDTPVKETNGDASEADDNLSLEELFDKLGLSNFVETFQKEQIDMETLTMCEESDIKEMGLPMGPRKKLQTFIKNRKKKQEKREIEAAVASQLEAQRRLQEEQQAAASQAAAQASTRELTQSLSNTSVSYVCGDHGTGALDIVYPQLDFSPANFFALGSPVAMFLTVRGQETLGDDFKMPTCPGYFNIFHPFDPVAYRLEPLLVPSFPAKPVLMPHHKGRKRLHLELREGLSRVGADIKQKIMDSLKTTWRTINDFALAHRSTPESIEEEVDTVVTQMTREQEDDRDETGSITSSMMDEEGFLGSLNQGRRIDYVLQEAPIESFNDYLFALGSHACYWESEDTVLMLLKEIYALLGFAPQRPGQEPTAPQLYRRSPPPLGPPPGAGMPFPPSPSSGMSPMRGAPPPMGGPPPPMGGAPPPMGGAPPPMGGASPPQMGGAALYMGGPPPQMGGAAPPTFAPGMPPPMSGFVRK